MGKQKLSTQYNFFDLLDKMISQMSAGKKLLPNGKQYSSGTIDNYRHLRRLLFRFSSEKKFELKIVDARRLTMRELKVQRNYWKKFYLHFTSFLYNDLNCFDNFVGSTVKLLRAFFGHLRRDLMIDTGLFYKDFYVRNEQIPVLALTPEQLRFLIYNKDFESKLSAQQRKVKDIFVFGCTTALRFSDLRKLTKGNIVESDNSYYLFTKSQKTKTYARVKLPDYAVEILKKYKARKTGLLPLMSLDNLNFHIKQLIEKAGWVEPVKKVREKRGNPKEIRKETISYRFCDLVSSHTMRRTAITTMLTLGVPEHIVRNVSGHAAGSKEFFKYVAIAQIYKDRELDTMFSKLQG